MPIYMKLPGIPGEATAAGYEDQIELNAMQWGESNQGAGAAGSDVIVQKFADRSTPPLMVAVFQGKIFTSCVISVTHASTDNPLFVKYTLSRRHASLTGARGLTQTGETVGVFYTLLGSRGFGAIR